MRGSIINKAIRNASGTFSLADTDHFVKVDAPTTITLYAISSSTIGYCAVVENIGGNEITINTSGSDTINGHASIITNAAVIYLYVTAAGEWITHFSDLGNRVIESSSPVVDLSTETNTFSVITVLCDASLGAVTVTLPLLAAGLKVSIKKIDNTSNTVTVVPESTGNIDGNATKVISSQWACISLESNGIDRFII